MVGVMARPSILMRLKLWHRRAQTRRHLADLPPHLLRDTGIDDAARGRECGRWFWQGAADTGAAQQENGRCLRAPVQTMAVLDKL